MLVALTYTVVSLVDVNVVDTVNVAVLLNVTVDVGWVIVMFCTIVLNPGDGVIVWMLVLTSVVVTGAEQFAAGLVKMGPLGKFGGNAGAIAIGRTLAVQLIAKRGLRPRLVPVSLSTQSNAYRKPSGNISHGYKFGVHIKLLFPFAELSISATTVSIGPVLSACIRRSRTSMVAPIMDPASPAFNHDTLVEMPGITVVSVFGL